MDISRIEPIILAGGKGTRLQSVVKDRPKVLALVRNRPFLSYLFDVLVLAGFGKVTLSTGYLGEMVEAEFGPAYKGMHLNYCREPFPLGTGGGLRRTLSLVKSDKVLVLNGDSFVDVNLLDFLEQSYEAESCASLVLKKVIDSSRFGLVELSGDNLVTKFSEKCKDGGAGLINAGIYYFDKTVVMQRLQLDEEASLERSVLQPLAEEGLLHGVVTDGQFIDIGLPDSYAEAESFFESK